MNFHVLTIFPEIISGGANASILGKAIERNIVRLNTVDIREYTEDRHRVVDDYPYGGGPGMVMKAEPIVKAVRSLSLPESTPLLLLSPQGQRFDHAKARELASHDELALICGRYEGIDERVRDILPVQELSIGDFVLSGGEFAALAVIDAVARLVPGVLGDDFSSSDDSFANGLLEYPQYTRPARFMDLEVPGILLSGDHGRIAAWRRRTALLNTLEKRPDLLKSADLTDDERDFIKLVQKNNLNRISSKNVKK
jgi:tRNA (guanine37-N1)-methyltransferase